MGLRQRRRCLTLASLPENEASLNMQVMPRNFKLRPEKCSAQSRYGRYGSYVTGPPRIIHQWFTVGLLFLGSCRPVGSKFEMVRPYYSAMRARLIF